MLNIQLSLFTVFFFFCLCVGAFETSQRSRISSWHRHHPNRPDRPGCLPHHEDRPSAWCGFYQDVGHTKVLILEIWTLLESFSLNIEFERDKQEKRWVNQGEVNITHIYFCSGKPEWTINERCWTEPWSVNSDSCSFQWHGEAEVVSARCSV